ncbi:MAG: UDP-N-acetylmuramoyl-L-alanyl-D-glutamate--2,6-diaminopimelate ligase [Chloroflexi bacterium]|nr:UDP-N-acetylmuramoyl-L-alanyl-D-glutamate--2,6-diaminopimelate ligase [Chloroflexota bacterium]
MSKYTISLPKLLESISPLNIENSPNLKITEIVLDSRQAHPEALFVALPGLRADGHDYIQDAVEHGAAAVVGSRSSLEIPTIPAPYFRVRDSRQALARLSAALYDFPARKLTMIGVTGTDGKTTTANLIYHILLAAKHKVGMISTVNAVIGEKTLDTGFHVTTPEAPDVQRYLAQMVDAGLTHVILEATSHGLAQNRVGACYFDVGVVTNITHEHLDYHGSYEDYQRAKGRLFLQVAATKTKFQDSPHAAIINADDQSHPYLRDLVAGQGLSPITYGFSPGADVRAESIHHTSAGLRFCVVGREFKADFETNLLGEYNVANCLAAVAATVEGMGVDVDVARAGVAALPGIPGRMQPIDLGQDFLAIVDFAHTPNALRRALQAGREMTQGQVIAVFGSAGLRDKAKRRLMAEISAEMADLTILTAEDPRTESLEGILAEMAEGARSRGGQEGENFWRLPDRGEALRFALSLAQPGDVVLACGKGHEQSMCFGETEYPWDDRTALHAALAEHLGVEGPEMPQLPTGGVAGVSIPRGREI